MPPMAPLITSLASPHLLYPTENPVSRSVIGCTRGLLLRVLNAAAALSMPEWPALAVSGDSPLLERRRDNCRGCRTATTPHASDLARARTIVNGEQARCSRAVRSVIESTLMQRQEPNIARFWKSK